MGHRVRVSPLGELVQPESVLLSQVMAYAHMRGWRCWHDQATNAPRRCHACGTARRGPRNAPGFPDLVLLRARHAQPRIVIAELKAEGEKPTPSQRAYLDDFAACGIETYVWTTSAEDWETIKGLLF
jgi:hypothetical protein